MYWWNIEALKNDLEQGPLRAPVAFRYVLANALLVSLSLVLPNPPAADLRTWIVRVATVGVTILGLLHCYRQNGGASGCSFMDRYFAISWVMYMRAAAVVVVLALGVAAPTSAFLPEAGRRVLYSMMAIAWLAFLYWRMGIHIRDVAERHARATSGAATQRADTG